MGLVNSLGVDTIANVAEKINISKPITKEFKNGFTRKFNRRKCKRFEESF